MSGRTSTPAFFGLLTSGTLSKLNGDEEPLLKVGNADVQLSRVTEITQTAP